MIFRPPEEWELNIIAIERGEWSEHMSEEAFRKYKKERPKLKDCAFLVEEEEQSTSKSLIFKVYGFFYVEIFSFYGGGSTTNVFLTNNRQFNINDRNYIILV